MIEVNKRGQGEVVTTVLLVLLVLAAVALITPFLLGFLQKGAKSVTAACLELKLDPVSCASGTAVYKWSSGAVNLTGVKLIFYTASGTSTVTDITAAADVPKILETRSVTVLPNSASFTVAGVVLTESGDKVTCSENPNKVACS